MGYFDEAIAKQKEDELSHHGILGMKWGIRRYQNPDGSLTPAGKARAEKVANSKFKSYMDTKGARKVYKMQAKDARAMSTVESKKAARLEQKASKYAKGTEDHKKFINESKEAVKKSKEYSKISEIANKKVKDIDDGVLKAGRDFILQKDVNVNLTRIPHMKATIEEMYHPILGEHTYINMVGTTKYTVVDIPKEKK